MCTRHDHKQRGIVWMDGRRPVVTARPTRSGGWIVSWKDRNPYVNNGKIARGARNHARHFPLKADAVADVEGRLACTA